MNKRKHQTVVVVTIKHFYQINHKRRYNFQIFYYPETRIVVNLIEGELRILIPTFFLMKKKIYYQKQLGKLRKFKKGKEFIMSLGFPCFPET